MSTIDGKHIQYIMYVVLTYIYIFYGARAASISEPACIRRNSIRRTGPVSDPSVTLSGKGGGWFGSSLVSA